MKAYRPKYDNKSDLFASLFNYWSVKLLNKTYKIVRDNRITCPVLVECNGNYVIRYNSRILSRCSFGNIISFVFHEIGHIFQGNVAYESDNQKIKWERDAEEFSLQMLKKYYKREYKEICKIGRLCLKSEKWIKKCPIYYEAFKEIKDYQ